MRFEKLTNRLQEAIGEAQTLALSLDHNLLNLSTCLVLCCNSQVDHHNLC